MAQAAKVLSPDFGQRMPDFSCVSRISVLSRANWIKDSGHGESSHEPSLTDELPSSGTSGLKARAPRGRPVKSLPLQLPCQLFALVQSITSRPERSKVKKSTCGLHIYMETRRLNEPTEAFISFAGPKTVNPEQET